MICYIYRSNKKTGAYLYLARETQWDDLPEELVKLLGDCTKVMQLNLAKRDKLASEDIAKVRENLKGQGYHLQMPPRDAVNVVNYGQ